MQVVVPGSKNVGDEQTQVVPEMTRLLTQEEQVVVELQVLQTGIHTVQIPPDSVYP